MLDRLCRALIFTKLDLWTAYHLIPTKDNDEYKTEFRTGYGQFEYQVMPFRWRNAPATVQAYFDICIQRFIDNFAACYFDNILIYSTNEEVHAKQVRKFHEKLWEFFLNSKITKCHFGVTEVSFLWFVISPYGIESGIGPYIKVRGLANPEVCSTCDSAARIHKLPLSVYEETCKGNNTDIWPAEESRYI